MSTFLRSVFYGCCFSTALFFLFTCTCTVVFVVLLPLEDTVPPKTDARLCSHVRINHSLWDQQVRQPGKYVVMQVITVDVLDP